MGLRSRSNLLQMVLRPERLSVSIGGSVTVPPRKNTHPKGQTNARPSATANDGPLSKIFAGSIEIIVISGTVANCRAVYGFLHNPSEVFFYSFGFYASQLKPQGFHVVRD